MIMKKFFLGILVLGFLNIGCSNDDGEISFEDQLAIDGEIIDDFLAENNVNAQTHSSGIRFVRTENGTGDAPVAGNVAVLKYSANVLGEENFAESVYGESFTINSNLIDALEIMLPEINEGGRMIIYAPSVYCFGRQGTPSIPSNSNIRFDVRLVDVVTNADEQFSADTTIIESYLEANEIETEIHSSGIRFTIIEEGNGESPDETSEVEVKYTGTLVNDVIFDQNTEGVSFPLENLIEGWQIMLPQIQEGGRIKIYMPSRYGYGTTGTTNIPPNTVLIFDIELLSIN